MNVIKVIKELREFPLIRVILYPIGKIRRKKEFLAYQSSEEPEKVKRYKEIHKDERCFLIGNGPSLTIDDLNMIENEICFATNRIYAIYDKTNWRPTYYVSIDRDILKIEYKNIASLDCKHKFLDFSMKEKCGEAIYILSNPFYHISGYKKKSFIKEDVSEFFSHAGTVMFTMIQLAIYMGFKEIYLLGNDFNMPYYKDKFGFVHRTDALEAHFKGGDAFKRSYMCKDAMLYGFQQAKEYCNAHGIIIKNATRGGKLEVFERVHLEDLL